MQLTKISVLPKDQEAANILAATSTIGDGVEAYRAYYIETVMPMSEKVQERLRAVFDSQNKSAVFGDPPDTWECRPTAEVSYHEGIVDNEQESIRAACSFVGIDIKRSKSSVIYACDNASQLEAVLTLVANPAIESVARTPPKYDTLRPSGEYQPPVTYDLRSMSDAVLTRVGTADGRNLSLRQMRQIRDLQHGLNISVITDVLLESLDARWSDHCYHTTWKAAGDLLSVLRRATDATRNDNIVSAFVDNAGVWRFYGGWALAIKAETHNGPTAIAPYFGQLTKLGGVLRDILGTGHAADPIAVYEYTATGLPTSQRTDDRPPPTEIARETVRAISEYGNTFGAPMAWSRLDFHPRYAAKPFALGGAVGVIPQRAAKKQAPAVGDYAVLIGGPTGNDGIHGASASSAGSAITATSVQIGSPLEEVKFREALLELRDAGCLNTLTDLGGGGLNSACGEMGDPVGVWMNTALVPLKGRGLPMWRILLSESQERMLLAVPKEQLDNAYEILSRHYVPHAAIGRFDGSGRFTVFHDPELAIDDETPVAVDVKAVGGDVGFSIPYSELTYAPEPLQIAEPPRDVLLEDELKLAEADVGTVLAEILATLRVCSQRSVSSRYDSTVRGDTVHSQRMLADEDSPCAYFACTPVRNRPYAALLSAFFDPYLAEANPIEACRQGFVAVASRLRWAGSRLEDIALCDNFFTPHESMKCFDILAAMVGALANLSTETGVPFISGKDSSAGSTEMADGWHHVPHAVFLSAIGKVPDARQLRSNKWSSSASTLLLVGPRSSSLGGTVAAEVLGLRRNGVDSISTSILTRYLRTIPEAAADILSFLPIECGGLAATLARASIAFERRVELNPGIPPLDLFREDRMCAIAQVPSDLDSRHLFRGLDALVVGTLQGSGVGMRYRDHELLSPSSVGTWRSRLDEVLGL